MNWFPFGRRQAPALSSTAAPAASRDEAILGSLLALAWVVEARDPYTGGHLWRVSRYAALLCERAGLPARDCARITIGAFLHDLGKVGVPDAILRKPGPLDDAERAVMRTHPTVGERLLAGHPLGSWVREAVLLHHERLDGTGYPAGLKGKDVPLAARIVGLCDAFDAMTSHRAYHRGLPVTEGLSLIAAGLGSEFDADLGAHFIALGDQGLLDHVAGHGDDGIPLQHCLTCGPTIAPRRTHGEGAPVFCPACGTGYRLSRLPDGGLGVTPSGAHGIAADLAPEADVDLIRRFVAETARQALAVAEPA